MRTLVLGAALSGVAAARLARRLGHSVVLYDRRSVPVELMGEGIGLAPGSWDPVLLDGIDLVVTSPGIPERARPITDAMEWGVPVISEIEFGWQQLQLPTVAITGTNGKTTVTELVAEMLRCSGMSVAAVGNIGQPISEVSREDLELLVVEVSSFQLRFIDRFHAQVAVITNLDHDHLDWHGSFAGYAAAKARIFERQGPEDLVIFDASDRPAAELAARAPGRSLGIADVVRAGALEVGGIRIPLDELQVDDAVFHIDLALAGSAALEVGADPAAVAAVARRFVPGAHRRRTVGEHGGVRFVDDSKASNPHAALAAIRSYPSVVLIAGGLDKGLDIAALAREPNLRAVIAMGTSAPLLLEAAGELGHQASSMEEAVGQAVELAEPGDVVLLSPGGASWDMFTDYRERGDAFSRAVSAIMEAE